MKVATNPKAVVTNVQLCTTSLMDENNPFLALAHGSEMKGKLMREGVHFFFQEYALGRTLAVTSVN